MRVTKLFGLAAVAAVGFALTTAGPAAAAGPSAQCSTEVSDDGRIGYRNCDLTPPQGYQFRLTIVCFNGQDAARNYTRADRTWKRSGETSVAECDQGHTIYQYGIDYQPVGPPKPGQCGPSNCSGSSRSDGASSGSASESGSTATRSQPNH